MVLAPSADLLEAPGGESRAYPWSPGRTARALSRRGAYIEVESVVASPGCHPSFDPIDRVRLRVWVHEDDLMEVVIKPLDLEFADGSAMHVFPGTPVRRRADGARELVLGRSYLVLPIPEDALGRVFVGGSERAPGQELELPVTPAPTLNGLPVPLESVARVRRSVIGNPARAPLVFPPPMYVVYSWRRAPDDALLVELRSRCGPITARVETDATPQPMLTARERERPLVDRPAAIMPDEIYYPYKGPGYADERYTAREGAAVYWPSGIQAGTTIAGAVFKAPGQRVEGRRCFHGVGAGIGSPLCLDEADLELRRPDRLRGGGGGYG